MGLGTMTKSHEPNPNKKLASVTQLVEYLAFNQGV